MATTHDRNVFALAEKAEIAKRHWQDCEAALDRASWRMGDRYRAAANAARAEYRRAEEEARSAIAALTADAREEA